MINSWRFPRTLPAVIAIMAVTGGAHAVAQDQPLAGGSEALGMFFDLGLPDSRGAKWVAARLSTMSGEDGLPRASAGRYSGNAWLLRESADGTVDLLMGQCKLVRARRSTSGSDASSDGLPEVDIRPADLEADVALLIATLTAKDSGDQEDYRVQQRRQSAGHALLFVAHLQRQNQPKLVAQTLPAVMALMPSHTLVIDRAVSLLADMQADKAGRDWIARGDTRRYINTLKELEAKFSRGWKNRDAVALLVERLGMPAAPPAKEPEVAKMTALLLALKPGDIDKLNLKRNWYLPGKPSRGGFMDDMEESEGGSAEAENTANPEPKVQAPPLARYVAEHKHQAAAGLAGLLNNHRLVRIERDQPERGGYEREQTSSAEKLKEAYEALPRPYELGELAWELLEPILPQSYSFREDSGREATTAEWLRETAGLNDEDLAWDALRRCNSTYQAEFSQSLGYLVDKGGDQTLKQLRDVFLDPAVWRNGSVQSMIPSLQAYVKRIGTDEDFTTKLKAAVLAKAREENGSGDEWKGEEIDASSDPAQKAARKKQREEAAGLELKLLDQALKPRDTKALLAELATSKPEETQQLLQLLMPQLAKLPFAQAEAQIYQSAAKTPGISIKKSLIMALQQLGRRTRASANAAIPKMPADPATREALNILLKEESPAAEPDADDLPMGSRFKDFTVARLTATSLVWPRLPPAETGQWTELSTLAPDLVQQLLKERAHALVNDTPPPALPDGSKISPEQTQALVNKLEALPAEQVAAAVGATPADEQIALLGHLKKLPQWPPGLIAARLIIRKVEAKPGPDSDPAKWQGKVLSLALKKEFQAMVEKAAADKQPMRISLQAGSLLSGLTLHIGASSESVPGQMLTREPNLKFQGKLPAALVFGEILAGNRGETVYIYPVFNNPADTQGWLSERSKIKDSELGGILGQSDPKRFEDIFRTLLQMSPQMRGPVNISWATLLIQNSQPEN